VEAVSLDGHLLNLQEKKTFQYNGESKMNTIQRIAKNTGILLISQILSYVITFFFTMYTARYLGAEGFGILSFAIAFTAIFGVFSDLGLNTLMVREVARNKSLAQKYLLNTALMKTILAIITSGLIVLMINILGYPEQTIKVVYLITLSVILNTFSQMFYSIFRAYERMEYQSVGQILNSALMLPGALFAISQELSVVGFAFIYFIVSVAVLGYNFIVCVWKFVKPKMEIDLSFWKPIIKNALPFSLTFIIGSMFYNTDIAMLSTVKGDEFAGWYKAAVTLILVISSASASFVHATFPMMSKLFVSDRNTLKIMLEKSSKYLFIIALPISAGIFLLADRFILLIYGAEFTPATIALRILSLYLPLRVISNVTGWALASINREPLRTLSAGIALSLNVCLNFTLIPIFGIAGASTATAISQILLFTLYFYFVNKHLCRLPFHSIIVKPCISCLVMILFLHFIKNNLFIIIIISAMIYIFSLFILKTFDSYDKKIFNDLIISFGQLLRKGKLHREKI